LSQNDCVRFRSSSSVGIANCSDASSLAEECNRKLCKNQSAHKFGIICCGLIAARQLLIQFLLKEALSFRSVASTPRNSLLIAPANSHDDSAAAATSEWPVIKTFALYKSASVWFGLPFATKNIFVERENRSKLLHFRNKFFQSASSQSDRRFVPGRSQGKLARRDRAAL
jgi:hypothetical protein